MPSLRSPLFFFILAVYLLAGALFATLTPDWQAPDEPAHYNYVHYLAAQSGFPELVSGCYNQTYLQQLTTRRFPPELSITPLCYEFHQPPLYYVLAVPLFSLTYGSLLALRLFSVILGGGVVTLAFLIGRAIFPERPIIAYGTMVVVAFVPMHVAMLASTNNDALAELILAALLLLLIRRIMVNQPVTVASNLRLGLLLGLGLITKTTVYIAVPLIAVALWGEERGRLGRAAAQGQGFGWDWPEVIKQVALIYGLALLIAGPWYFRNAALYGQFDILGLARHDEVVVGQLRTADFIAQVGWSNYLREFIVTTFQSFWGQFGWMAVPMSDRVYLALTLFSLIALGGVGLTIVNCQLLMVNCQLSEDNRRAVRLMGLTIGLMALGYLWYNLQFKQFQGRYLFPALIPLGLFFTIGLYIALSWLARWWLVAGLVLAGVGVLLAGSLSGDLDGWAVLMTALFLVLALSRIWLARFWMVPTPWLLAVVYSGLALLTLVSPFWYVIPYLSP